MDGLDITEIIDTVNHAILLDRLSTEFGVTGPVLNWFTSFYPTDHRVSMDGVLSVKFNLDCGVPQGSCLGPLLFVIIYSSKLFLTIEKHLPNVHCYADDTQLYLAFKPGNDTDEVAALRESCIADIRRWMLSDKLKLNLDKTEFLIMGMWQQLAKVKIENLCVGDCRITPSSTAVKNLNMLTHINKTCSYAFYHLHNIQRIRKYLTRQSVESLIHAFVMSKIDYCNGLLYGLPSSHILKLQRVQNAVARLVTGSPRFCHITPVLISLHWLPIKFRVNYKIVLLIFKCLHGLAPKYLADLIKVNSAPRYNLRSTGTISSTPASAKCFIMLRDRAFQQAAPKLWNNLPTFIRNLKSLNSFKAAIETRYFKFSI